MVVVMLVMVIVVMIIMIDTNLTDQEIGNVVNINGMTRKTIIIGISEFEIKTQKVKIESTQGISKCQS